MARVKILTIASLALRYLANVEGEQSMTIRAMNEQDIEWLAVILEKQIKQTKKCPGREETLCDPLPSGEDCAWCWFEDGAFFDETKGCFKLPKFEVVVDKALPRARIFGVDPWSV